MAQHLRSSLPPTCRWLDLDDINLVGELPIAAGGFGDIYGATHGGRKVLLKSLRCYVSVDIAQAAAVGGTTDCADSECTTNGSVVEVS